MKHVLFICSQNRLRSPTAEQVFSGRPGFEVASAGLNPEAETVVCPELLEWADVIFVMQRAHRNKLSKKFRAYLGNKRIICLDIPDVRVHGPGPRQYPRGEGRRLLSAKLMCTNLGSI